eukprot:1569894-Pyramimonas_sp.AAC.1
MVAGCKLRVLLLSRVRGQLAQHRSASVAGRRSRGGGVLAENAEARFVQDRRLARGSPSARFVITVKHHG